MSKGNQKAMKAEVVNVEKPEVVKTPEQEIKELKEQLAQRDQVINNLIGVTANLRAEVANSLEHIDVRLRAHGLLKR